MGVDNYSKGQMMGLGFTFLILPCIFVVLRVWSKWISRRRLMWDDYLIFVALAFSIACSITQIIGTIDGELGQHQTIGPDGQPLLDDPHFITYEKCKFASQLLAVVGMGFTKASLLALFHNIFKISQTFQRVSIIMLFVVCGWTISFFFSNLFTCYPVTPFVEPFYGHKCINSIPMWYTSCVTDVVVDLIILIMPLPLVMKLSMPLRKKLAVAGLFFMGTTVVVISITRMAMYFHVGTTIAKHFNDETYYTSPVFFWTNIEISLGVILACLPTLRPLWVHSTSPVSTVKSLQARQHGSSSNSRPSQKRTPGNIFNELDTFHLMQLSNRDTGVQVEVGGESEQQHGSAGGNNGLVIAIEQSIQQQYSKNSGFDREGYSRIS